jgi:hypothetical protein
MMHQLDEARDEEALIPHESRELAAYSAALVYFLADGLHPFEGRGQDNPPSNAELLGQLDREMAKDPLAFVPARGHVVYAALVDVQDAFGGPGAEQTPVARAKRGPPPNPAWLDVWKVATRVLLNAHPQHPLKDLSYEIEDQLKLAGHVKPLAQGTIYRELTLLRDK